MRRFFSLFFCFFSDYNGNMSKLEDIRTHALSLIEGVSDLLVLDNARTKILGRKSELSLFLRSLKDMPPENQRGVGAAANALRAELEELFEKKLRVGDKVTIKDKSFSIAGFLQRTGQPFGETFVMMNEEDMKNLLDINDEWDIIVGKVAEGIDSVAIGKTLDKRFLQDRGLKEWEKDYTIQTPDDIIDSLGNILLVVQAILVGIASISLIVGGIGIMNTMYTAVLERTGEIGIIKSIGARNSTVLLIFLFESGMLGLVGGLIGLLLGVILSLTVQFFGTLYFGTQLLNASFPTYLMIGALLFSFSVGSFAGTFPAVRASRLKPVDALRYRK